MSSKSITKISHYESKALRSYWTVHIEAWLRSGITRSQYCDEHRLDRRTMQRWLKVFDTPLPKHRKREKKPAPARLANVPAARTIAHKAFWLMHAEAQLGSGLTATQYANAHRLPVRRMRRESKRFTSAAPAQNWREMLHRSTRPSCQPGTNLRQELRQSNVQNVTVGPSIALAPSDAASKRRQYTQEQKLAIIAEATEPGAQLSAVARRHGVTASMIIRWRSQAGLDTKEKPLLLTARVLKTPTRGRPKQMLPLVLQDLLRTPAEMMSVELADGRRVFVPEGSDPNQVRQYIADKETLP